MGSPATPHTRSADSLASEAGQGSQRSVNRDLAWVIALALLVRLVALVATSPTGLMNDELDYHHQAAQVARGTPLGDANGRPPGVILLYAGLYRVFGAAPAVARSANVALDVLCVALVFLIGRSFSGRRVGLIAALIAACYPSFIGFSHALWSEPLYLAFTLIALALVLAYRERHTSWKLVGAGFAFGFAALTREVGLVTAVLTAGWLAFDTRPAFKSGALRAALLLAPVFLVLLPWSAHVRGETGQFVLSSGTTWFNLYVGNGESANIRGQSVDPWSLYPALGKTRMEREHAARKLSLGAIANRLPWWPFEKLTELGDLFAPHSFMTRRLSYGPGNPLPPPWFGSGDPGYTFRFEALNSWSFRRGAILFCSASYVLLILGGIAGLILARNRSGARLFLLVMLAHVAPTLAAFALTRHRLPLMMIMTVTAATLIADLPGCWRDASRARRSVALVITGAMLALLALAPEPLR